MRSTETFSHFSRCTDAWNILHALYNFWKGGECQWIRGVQKPVVVGLMQLWYHNTLSLRAAKRKYNGPWKTTGRSHWVCVQEQQGWRRRASPRRRRAPYEFDCHRTKPNKRGGLYPKTDNSSSTHGMKVMVMLIHTRTMTHTHIWQQTALWESQHRNTRSISSKQFEKQALKIKQWSVRVSFNCLKMMSFLKFVLCLWTPSCRKSWHQSIWCKSSIPKVVMDLFMAWQVK